MADLIRETEHIMSKWWALFILGAVMLIVGFAVLRNPAASYAALTVLFAFSFLASGIMRVVFSIGARRDLPHWPWQLALGALNLVLGGFLLANPALAAITLAFVVGFYFMFASANIISEAFDIKSAGEKSGWTMTFGIIGMIASFFLLFHPLLGVGTLILWTAVAFISHGVFYLWSSLRLRSGYKVLHSRSKAA